MIARPLGATAALMIVLETVRATNLIVHDATLGGVSFVGTALPGWLVAVGGPCAATFVLIAAGLAWQGKRVGYALVGIAAALFVVTHVLDQLGIPGPEVAVIGARTGMFFAWITMFWMFTAVVTFVLAAYALTRRVR